MNKTLKLICILLLVLTLLVPDNAALTSITGRGMESSAMTWKMGTNSLKADGVHGKVDNLHISYDGNRITTVLEDADAVTQNGSMDYPGIKREMEFEYNDWGALVRDESRGITDITYDRFGNPIHIDYADGSYTENVYSATGEKLRTVNVTSLFGIGVTAQSTVDYRGSVIYRNGVIDMVLFPGGYATINGTAVTFHYYTQDYLGNNRAVINGSTGAIEQTVAYYPYGAVISDLGTPTTGQPYKFGGKELISSNGLNEYDFGARQYYPAVPGFTRIDPLCEKYYWLSPYLYCANNPVNLVDPTGRIIELPKETTSEQLFTVMWNLSQLTDDKLVFKTQNDGSFRIKIASTGKGSLSAGTRLIRILNSSNHTVSIGVVNNKDNGIVDKNKENATNYKGTDVIVRFNPKSSPSIPLKNKNNDRVRNGERPSYIGLSHELVHADRSTRGAAYDYKLKVPYRFFDGEGNPVIESIRMEEAATIGLDYTDNDDITENDIRKEHGLPLRGAYGN